tara:strand:+ start:57 stop:1070 length:1014 start_codon:yes stop_codon:yes gene_type:complete
MDAINSRLAAGGCPPTNLAEISSIVDFHARSKLEIDLAKTQKFLHDKELEWKQTEHDYLLEIKELNSQNEKNWGDLSEKIMGERDAMRFAEMEDYLMNLKTEVKAYETLTGVKRDDICAHADPNDDSLYTYKTYEEYETDAGQFDVLEVKVDDLEAEVLAAESENSEQHDQIEDLEYRLQNAICCIEIDGETLSEEDVKKLKLDHRLLVEIIEACGFDDDTSAQDLVAWVSDMADEHDPHKVGALESEIEELKEENDGLRCARDDDIREARGEEKEVSTQLQKEIQDLTASQKQKNRIIKKLREWVDRNQTEINKLRDVIDDESDEEEKTDLFGLKD